MSWKPRILVTIGLVAFCSTYAWSEEKATATSKPAVKLLFGADAYLEHIKYLASDELGGRGVGTEGGEKAAQYIVEQLQAAGCEPGGVDGTWFQPFEVRKGKQIVDEKALLEVSGVERTWKVREDWIPFPFTEMEDVEGTLAFAGYGISAEKYEYDDYDGFDAEGKILLILRHEPKDADPEAKFGGERPSRHAFFFRKARVAQKAGAKALLIVNSPNRDPDTDELYGFDSFSSQQTYDLPMVHVSRELAGALLEQAGLPDLKTLQEQLDQERKPLSQDLGLTIKLHPGVESNLLHASNVIGVLPGDGSTEETIVIGAHRDHIGTTQGDSPDPQIHNGADDNASGTAGVIEMAKLLGQSPKLRRNVMFIAFDGEESGLVGSREFVNHPTIDLANIKAMINFDMIGRLSADQFAIIGVPTAAEFPALTETAAAEVGVEYKASRGFGGGGSDHAPFIRRNIPILFMFTGIHKDYHQPTDDWELIDAEGAVRILHMSHSIVVELANMTEGPTYTEPSEEGEDEEPEIKPAVEEAKEAVEAADADEEHGDAEGHSDRLPSRGGLKVRLGIIPDMVGDDQPGMLVDAAIEGGPANEAGIQDGDRIIKIGDVEIRDVYAYMRSLQGAKPGDVVDVIVVRGGENKTVKVTLQESTRRRGRD